MPATVDFRTQAFDLTRVNSCAKNVGGKVYWKLFVIENLVRVVVHSVLSVQINPQWWTVAADADTQKQITKFRAQYAKQPWHSTPGKHEIYYTFLPDLSEIIRANSHLFRPTIPDIDQWVARIEQMRLPRNIVGHMNWPSVTDRKRIDVFYEDFLELVKKLAGARFPFLIP